MFNYFGGAEQGDTVASVELAKVVDGTIGLVLSGGDYQSLCSKRRENGRTVYPCQLDCPLNHLNVPEPVFLHFRRPQIGGAHEVVAPTNNGDHR